MKYIPQLRPCAWMALLTIAFVLCTTVVCACPPTPTGPYFPDPTDNSDTYTSKTLTFYDYKTGEVKTVVIIEDS